MDNSLNDLTQEKVSKLARHITVAQDLDPEIQEELYGHIEDKLLAYRDGDEPVSEEDAFILAREHFGNAETVKGMFQDVHREAVEGSLLRRLLVAAITTLVCVQGVAWLAHVADVLFWGENSRPQSSPYVLMLVSAAAYLVPWLCFVRWKRRMEVGKQVWFNRRSTLSLTFVFLVLFVSAPIMPGLWGVMGQFARTPSMLHHYLHQVVLNSWLGSDFPRSDQRSYSFVILAAFLLLNVGLFFTIVRGGLSFGRSASARPGAGRWYFVAWLWASVAFLQLVDRAGLNIVTGRWLEGLPFLILHIPVDLLWSAAILAFCCSWVWWCDTPPRLTRNTVKVVAAWAALLMAHAALPKFHAGLAGSGDDWLLSFGVPYGNMKVPGVDAWLFFSRSGNYFYFLPYLITVGLFLIFFAIVVVLTFRVYDRSMAPEAFEGK
jgi:hypothetical protein